MSVTFYPTIAELVVEDLRASLAGPAICIPGTYLELLRILGDNQREDGMSDQNVPAPGTEVQDTQQEAPAKGQVR